MNPSISDYLNTSSQERRLEILSLMRDSSTWLPLSLSRDLLCLRLSETEQIAIIQSTSNKDLLGFEDFMSRQIKNTSQNVATTALREWMERSNCILWHRMIGLCDSQHVSQRMAYTLLDLAWVGPGEMLIKKILAIPQLEEMSKTFLSLLLLRAIQWSVYHKGLENIALHHLEQLDKNTAVFSSLSVNSYIYLMRFSKLRSKAVSTISTLNTTWPQIMQSLAIKASSKIDKKDFEKVKSIKSLQVVLEKWPPLWNRHQLNSSQICSLLEKLREFSHNSQSPEVLTWFLGIPPENILSSMDNLSSEDAQLFAISHLHPLLLGSFSTALEDRVKALLLSSKDPSVTLAKLPLKLTALANANVNQKGVFDQALLEQQTMISGKSTVEFYDFLNTGRIEIDDQQRQYFFDLVYRRVKQSGALTEPWSTLALAWNESSQSILENIAAEARKLPQLLQLAYIDTLGQFKGIDAAALKLLDYIRSTEEATIRSVIHSLSGIGTIRSTQELVAFLTRPNISYSLQLEITALLEDKDVSTLQSELRSAINDILLDSEEAYELKETLSSLLSSETTETELGPSKLDVGDQDLDEHLKSKINSFNQLSGEARRALRTAQFFHLQVNNSGNVKTIDLSPAIDMQYKALELSFREKFENITFTIIREGSLQRKLDIIGYARPIPKSMDEFERYIEALPIISDIPFFSKFKLRKMLRAICQFRPGKRFTLDGLKAFALFLLCFSRKQCKYGLANILELPEVSDEWLFEFCRDLHIFQDFRNRAAHEGFHPDASNDLDGIWRNTANIIEKMTELETMIKNSSNMRQTSGF